MVLQLVERKDDGHEASPLVLRTAHTRYLVVPHAKQTLHKQQKAPLLQQQGHARSYYVNAPSLTYHHQRMRTQYCGGPHCGD